MILSRAGGLVDENLLKGESLLNYKEFLLKAGQDDRILRVGDEEFDQTSWVIRYQG